MQGVGAQLPAGIAGAGPLGPVLLLVAGGGDWDTGDSNSFHGNLRDRGAGACSS